MKKIACIILLLKFVGFAYGQSELFMPVEFQNAVEQGTRSSDGQPGVNYWQNKAEYKIRVKVEPENKRVIGEKIISYLEKMILITWKNNNKQLIENF
jgi:hypothetical protein